MASRHRDPVPRLGLLQITTVHSVPGSWSWCTSLLRLQPQQCSGECLSWAELSPLAYLHNYSPDCQREGIFSWNRQQDTSMIFLYMILRQLFFADNFNFFSQDWKATQTFISHEKRRWLSQALLRAADVGWAGSGVTLGCRDRTF